MPRKSTTKAAAESGKSESDIENATTTTVKVADVAAAAAAMGDVVDVGERATEVPPEVAPDVHPETGAPQDRPDPPPPGEPDMFVPPAEAPPVDPPPAEAPPPPEDVPPPLAEPPAPEALEAGVETIADADVETVVEAPPAEGEGEPVVEAAPAEPVSDETFFRCNGCGKPGPAADTDAESLEIALASGWYMSEHTPPLPYCCGSPPGDVAEFPFQRRGVPPAEPAAT